MPDHDTVTHLAGPAITIGNRSVQRCSICGEKLCDSKGLAAPVEPDGSPPKFSTWEPGRFVRVTPGNPTSFILLDVIEQGGKAPDDICMDLVE